MDALRVLGADVRPVPAVPFDNPDNYNHQARKGGGKARQSRFIVSHEHPLPLRPAASTVIITLQGLTRPLLMVEEL